MKILLACATARAVGIAPRPRRGSNTAGTISRRGKTNVIRLDDGILGR